MLNGLTTHMHVVVLLAVFQAQDSSDSSCLLLLLCVRCFSHLGYKVRDVCSLEFLPASIQLFLQRGVLRPCGVPFSLEQSAFLVNMLGRLFGFSTCRADQRGYKLQLFEQLSEFKLSYLESVKKTWISYFSGVLAESGFREFQAIPCCCSLLSSCTVGYCRCRNQGHPLAPGVSPGSKVPSDLSKAVVGQNYSFTCCACWQLGLLLQLP